MANTSVMCFGAFQKYFRQSSVRFIWLSHLSRGAKNSHVRIRIKGILYLEFLLKSIKKFSFW